MTRKNRVNDLRYDAVVIADNAWENRSAEAKFRHQIVAQFVLHAPGTQTLFGKWTQAQFAEHPRETHDGKPPGEQLMREIIRPRDDSTEARASSPMHSVNGRGCPCLH